MAYTAKQDSCPTANRDVCIQLPGTHVAPTQIHSALSLWAQLFFVLNLVSGGPGREQTQHKKALRRSSVITDTAKQFYSADLAYKWNLIEIWKRQVNGTN